MLNTLISIIFVIVCVFLTAVVLFQEGNEQGLGSIGGIADTYWGKNRGRCCGIIFDFIISFKYC